MSEKARARISWIRALLCIMIVFVHAQNTDWFETAGAPWIGDMEDVIAKACAYIGVSGFFFISGYLFFRNYRPRLLWNKLRKRVFSLVIPFLFWNLLTYLLYLFCSRAPGFSVLFAGKDVPFSVSELTDAVLFYKYNPVFWFMQHLIFFMALTPLISIILKNRWVSLSAVLCAFAFSIYLYQRPAPDIVQLLYPYLQTFTGFFLGCHCGFHEYRLFEKDHIPWYCAILPAVFPLFMTSVFLRSGSIASLQTVRFTAGACLLFAAAAIEFPAPKNWFRYTFFIYSTHQLLLSLMNKFCAVIISSNMIFGGILFCILPAAAIFICSFAGKIIASTFPCFAKFLGISR